MERPHPDLLAVAASLVSLGMLGVYLGIMRRQQDDPATFAVVALLVGASAAGYGAVRSSPLRRVALAGAALVLGLLGLLAILSIGLPILVAAGMCGLAALRHRGVGVP